jgi:hypothetical protein
MARLGVIHSTKRRADRTESTGVAPPRSRRRSATRPALWRNRCRLAGGPGFELGSPLANLRFRGVPFDLHAKQSVRSGSGSGGCGRFVKSKSYERSVASRSRSVNRESPQLVSMKRRTLENSPT